VLVAFAGLLVLCHALWRETPYLALLAAGAIVATAAAWAVLQAVDGATLKQAVDAWAAAPANEEAPRFGDAETVRWSEWGLRSYFRLLLGVAFLLLGAAAVVSRLVPSWLGVLLVLAGMLSRAVGLVLGVVDMERGLRVSDADPRRSRRTTLAVVRRDARGPGFLPGPRASAPPEAVTDRCRLRNPRHRHCSRRRPGAPCCSAGRP
jgi:hypothetical protein